MRKLIVSFVSIFFLKHLCLLPEQLLPDIKSFTRNLSTLLRTTVKLKRDPAGKEMIFALYTQPGGEYTQGRGAGHKGHRDVRSLDPEHSGAEIIG